jgi:hypothetical protein
MTLVTSGRIGFGSSASADLQQSLVNRLMQRFDMAGSTLFVETWKRRSTPLRRRYWEHTARARRTSVKGCTSVPTPDTGMNVVDANWEVRRQTAKEKHGNNGFGMTIVMAASLASVPSPKASDDNSSRYADPQRGSAVHYARPNHSTDLAHTVQHLASVPTPMAGSPATETYNAAGNSDYSRRIVELATVITPTQEDHKSDGPKAMEEYDDAIREGRPVRESAQRLRNQARLAAVTTPSSREWKDTSGMSESGVDPDGSTRSRLDQLPRQAQLADSGVTATGGSDATASTGQLDPAYSRWLMGVKPEWDGFVCTATRSVSQRRKHLLKATSKRG